MKLLISRIRQPRESPRLIQFLLFCTALFLFCCSDLSSPMVQASVARFRELYSEGHFRQIYLEGSREFHTTSEVDTVSFLEAVYRKLGKLKTNEAPPQTDERCLRVARQSSGPPAGAKRWHDALVNTPREAVVVSLDRDQPEARHERTRQRCRSATGSCRLRA